MNLRPAATAPVRTDCRHQPPSQLQVSSGGGGTAGPALASPGEYLKLMAERQAAPPLFVAFASPAAPRPTRSNKLLLAPQAELRPRRQLLAVFPVSRVVSSQVSPRSSTLATPNPQLLAPVSHIRRTPASRFKGSSRTARRPCGSSRRRRSNRASTPRSHSGRHKCRRPRKATRSSPAPTRSRPVILSGLAMVSSSGSPNSSGSRSRATPAAQQLRRIQVSSLQRPNAGPFAARRARGQCSQPATNTDAVTTAMRYTRNALLRRMVIQDEHPTPMVQAAAPKRVFYTLITLLPQALAHRRATPSRASSSSRASLAALAAPPASRCVGFVNSFGQQTSCCPALQTGSNAATTLRSVGRQTATSQLPCTPWNPCSSKN